MARIVGAVATSHIPLIGKAIANGWQNEPTWKPFFDSYAPVFDWLRTVKPDVAVVVYNDHGLNFFLDKMPTFAIGAAAIPICRGTSSSRSSPTSSISHRVRRCRSITGLPYRWHFCGAKTTVM